MSSRCLASEFDSTRVRLCYLTCKPRLLLVRSFLTLLTLFTLFTRLARLTLSIPSRNFYADPSSKSRRQPLDLTLYPTTQRAAASVGGSDLADAAST